MTTTIRRTETTEASAAGVLSWLARPVDIAALVVLRVSFGLIVAWEMWRYIDKGRIGAYYADPDTLIPYWPFTFVQPLGRPALDLVFWVVGAAGLAVALGAFYRVAATTVFVGLTYVFLLDKARYLNHFYLLCLIAFLMIWIAPHRSYSLDSRWGRVERRSEVPGWHLWLLRFQIGVPYVFGGLAKINADWLAGEPLRTWLSERTDFPVIGPTFDHGIVSWSMNYGALALDLLLVPALFHRRTRGLALVAMIGFHLMNARLFSIGIFPWFMIAATLVFLPADWPRRLWRQVADEDTSARAVRWLVGGAVTGFLLGAFLPISFSVWRSGIALVGGGVAGWVLGGGLSDIGSGDRFAQMELFDPVSREDRSSVRTVRTLTAVVLAIWVAAQILVPLRHFVTPGNVHWTEEGHNFAWHMKLRDKSASATFTVVADGETFPIDNLDYLNEKQQGKTASRPHMLVQFAHLLEDDFEARGYQDIEVTAVAWASLNHRPYQLLIDPTFDLTTQSYPWFGHADWILPLDEPSFDVADFD